jgi:hypothetical protein
VVVEETVEGNVDIGGVWQVYNEFPKGTLKSLKRFFSRVEKCVLKQRHEFLTGLYALFT